MNAFTTLLLGSKYTRQLEAAEAEETKQAEGDAARRGAAAELEFALTEVVERADEIAVLAYKTKFGRQNFVQTRHNKRGLDQMELHRKGLVRDAFCPAKREFVKAA